MSKKNKIIIEFMEELRRSSLDSLETAKVILLAVEYGNEHMTNFLRKAFEIEERRRPKLLEMK